jgi:hypothetical protein
MTEARTWQEDSGQAGIADVNSESGWNQHSIAGLDGQHLVNASAHIEASGAIGRVVRQGKVLTNPRVQYLQFNCSHKSLVNP